MVEAPSRSGQLLGHAFSNQLAVLLRARAAKGVGPNRHASGPMIGYRDVLQVHVADLEATLYGLTASVESLLN